MLIAPFHSFMRGIAVEDLWHDNDECQIGLSIGLIYRVAGTGSIGKHCQYCALLNQPLPPKAPKTS
ncbi:MAG: hypothetical protein EOO56_00805 [Hymenobacter sp.]|nr:MAG: hypothetical protein EOO56_00805 [Hymenobacter sp.]